MYRTSERGFKGKLILRNFEARLHLLGRRRRKKKKKKNHSFFFEVVFFFVFPLLFALVLAQSPHALGLLVFLELRKKRGEKKNSSFFFFFFFFPTKIFCCVCVSYSMVTVHCCPLFFCIILFLCGSLPLLNGVP